MHHVQLLHSHQPNFSITCGIGGCLRTFKTMGTFRNHVSAHHSNNVPVQTTEGIESMESGEDDDMEVDESISLIDQEDPHY